MIGNLLYISIDDLEDDFGLIFGLFLLLFFEYFLKNESIVSGSTVSEVGDKEVELTVERSLIKRILMIVRYDINALIDNTLFVHLVIVS